ncbi:3-hydroxyacyl-CoA dehydrogenase [Bifidobacterium actinocoloniiforme DSM 22766]|uniref:3-hydroxyacyl-CoA dehydrogenase n=1 Tax=Bifidobacterium actinocoloniiforme DSM 22766 TaxID=1437605 RepID=A0A086Z114_9BIFI|nr:3-hydroxyacyl-CoA dehydrogenase family protein [Bifidobacterium actinocoloniiforme]AKV55391.1 3-hydroxybutyryl-CoA dehydrogenase [Bifidobacterium actinocoloniiforme DSM 22766]KFI40214.1 3-hydroxyacyl-CoA dehydrogenase [Bifidobacterium actinocoloniiforme DSM 22766]
MNVEDIKVIGNIGAGTMGHATALQFAMNGYAVKLVDSSQEALERGTALIEHDLDTFIQAGLVQETERQAILDRIRSGTDYAALSDADFVIESVLEDMGVKREVWAKVESVVSEQAVLATNTSGLSPSAIATVLKRPQRFLVAHFWNPAQLMPLVEVVPSKETDKAAVDLTVELINGIGKHAVALSTESLGFVGNRIQAAVIRECMNIVNRGIATPEAVDEIVKYSLGRRWSVLGPIASADLGGLDIFDGLSKYMYADLDNNAGEDPTLKAKVAEGHLGAKTGQGFYSWQGADSQALIQERDRSLLKALVDDQKNGGAQER